MKSTTGFSLSVKALAIVALCFVAGGAFGQSDTKAESFYTGGAPAAEAMGWDLGCQAYSFNRFTFYEAVDKNKTLGMTTIEAYPGQKLSAQHGDATFDHHMSRALVRDVTQMLKAKGVTLVNYGVVGLPNDEAECRKVFAFAQIMGIETIVSEPPEDAFDLIDKLCQEYKIGVALHNHPKPSPYWDYKTVLRVCAGRSQWIGACADTGHWTRSGIDPVEAVRALGMAGRIRSLHFKDLNQFGVRNAHDVPWGTGKSKARESQGDPCGGKHPACFDSVNRKTPFELIAEAVQNPLREGDIKTAFATFDDVDREAPTNRFLQNVLGALALEFEA